MATVNTLKTRILNKYDLIANYSTFTPLKGEVCVAVIGEQVTNNKGLNGDITKTPIVGIKVGDGTTSFNNLPWIQAVAGDVSTFVKGIVDEAKFNQLVNALITAANLASADELSAFGQRLQTAEGNISTLQGIVVNGDDSNAKLRAAINAVLGTSSDTSTQNTVYGAKKYAEEKAAAAASALETGAVKSNTDAIGAINSKIGDTAFSGGTVSAAISALQSAVGDSAEGLGSKVDALVNTVGDANSGLVKDVADLKQADVDMDSRMVAVEAKLEGTTDVHDEISAVDAKVTTLIGSDTGMSVRTIAAEETAKIVAGADTSYDTLKEIADWIMSDTTGAAEMANDIAEMQGLLGVTEGAALPKTVDERITDAISGADFADNDTISALQTKVGTIETTYATKAYADQAEADAISTVVGASGDAKTANTVYGAKAFATDAAATAKSEAIAAAKTETETQVNALANGAVKSNTDAIGAVNSLIEGMDATYADTNAGVVAGIVQENGKITSVTQRKVKAADIDETDVFVFYCGNASGYDPAMATVTI